MCKQSPIKVDSKIFERLTNHYIKVYDYTPYTAKICSYLYFDYTRQGVTFDQIQEYFDVSKSTVSCCLNHLVEVNHISFYYKNGDRKRYFKIDKQFVKARYERICNNLLEEKKIIHLMKDHMNKLQVENENLDKRLNIFTETLNNSIHNLQSAIKKLEKVQ